MKTIQFHIETGMLAAVLERRKTQVCLPLTKLNAYTVGEVLAVVEPYWIQLDSEGRKDYSFVKQWGSNSNDMGLSWEWFEGKPYRFPRSIARNFVKITSISVKIPAEFTDAEFEAEGLKMEPYIDFPNDKYSCYYNYLDDEFNCVEDAYESFQSLLCAIYGEEHGKQIFESEMLVLTFERCTREGRSID